VVRQVVRVITDCFWDDLWRLDKGDYPAMHQRIVFALVRCGFSLDDVKRIYFTFPHLMSGSLLDWRPARHWGEFLDDCARGDRTARTRTRSTTDFGRVVAGPGRAGPAGRARRPLAGVADRHVAGIDHPSGPHRSAAVGLAGLTRKPRLATEERVRRARDRGERKEATRPPRPGALYSIPRTPSRVTKGRRGGLLRDYRPTGPHHR
jgi:hypothetical protein